MASTQTKVGGASVAFMIVTGIFYSLILMNPDITVAVGEPGIFNFTTIDRGTLYIYGVTDEESSTEWDIDVEFVKIIKWDDSERQASRILTSEKVLSDGTRLPPGTLQFLSWGYRDKVWNNNQFIYTALKPGKHHFVLVFGTEKAGYLVLDAYNEAIGPEEPEEKPEVEVSYNENVFTCYFEDWQGQQQKCRDMTLGDVWPYKIDEDNDFYYITRLDETLPPIPKEGTHTFTPNYIGWKFEIQKDELSTVRTAITNKLLPETHLKQFTYVQPTIIDSNGSRVYIYKDTLLLSKEIEWPLIVEDPWYVNSTEEGGWNISFIQSNLDENESVIPNIDNSISQINDAVSYYTFDNISGTTLFDLNQSSKNNGTITGTADAIGWRNRSRQFDGTASDYISILDSLELRFNDSFSICTRLYRTVDSGGYERLISKTDTTISFDIFFQITNGDVIQMGFDNPAGSLYYLLGTTTILTGRWYDICGTFDGTEFHLYIDGVEKDSGYSGDDPAGQTIRQSTATWEFGRLYSLGWNYEFNGRLDEILLTSTAFSIGDVINRFNGSFYSSSNITAPPLGQYRDAGSDNGIVNASVNVTLDGNASMNLYLNYSTDASTWNLELVQSGITSLTNYTPTFARYNHVIPECINTGGGICHIHEITVYEAAGTIDTQIFVRQANGSYEEQDILYDLWCSYYESQCQPDNQDSTYALVQVKNNGTGTGTGINCSINASVSNITAKMGNSSTYANASSLTTSNTTIWSETIQAGTNRSIWIWEDWQKPPTFDIIEYLCEVI